MRASRPFTAAALVAGSYAIVACIFFVAFGTVASRDAPSAAELAYDNLWRNIAFVGVTGVTVFGVSLYALRRIRRDEDRLAGTEDVLVRADQRAVAGTLAAGAAHDFRNLLMVLGGNVDLLEATPGMPPDARQIARQLRDATAHGVEIAQQLVAAGKGFDPTVRKRRSLGRLLRAVVDLVHAHGHVRRCFVEVRIAEEIEADVFPEILGQAVTNLLLNAAEATPGGHVQVLLLREAGNAVVQVHDDGPGITPEVEAHLFDSYVTTKPGGTGLGLLSVKVCARYHGGDARASRSPLGGMLFEIRLPLPSGAADMARSALSA